MADNTVGTTNNPSESMQTTEVVQNPAIYPNVIVTDSYLNDRITFEVDERFGEKSLINVKTDVNEAIRDVSQYVVVNGEVTGSVYYRVTMTSPLYDRNRMYQKINRRFTEFV
jgi:hypothetical protein